LSVKAPSLDSDHAECVLTIVLLEWISESPSTHYKLQNNALNTVTQYLIKYVTNAHNKIAEQKRNVI